MTDLLSGGTTPGSMFNDGYKDHQLEHGIGRDQLWDDVCKVIRNQTDDPERLLARSDVEDRGRPTAPPPPSAPLL